LFVSEFLIKLKIACGVGTDHFDAERYLREREAFGNQVMCWRSTKTIDIYDQTRSGESVLSLLATYQHDLSERRYVPALPSPTEDQSPDLERGSFGEKEPLASGPSNVIWTHDAETLAWIKKREARPQEQKHGGQL